MKCPIFQIIRDFLMTQADFKSRCFLKETNREGEIKQFYKILLPESRDALVMNSQILERREHHVSVYEDQAWSEKNYKSTYHYTGIFYANLAQIIIHVYFDANGQFCYIHVKDEKGTRIDDISEVDQTNIRLYAEAASMHVVSSIQAKASEISQNFENEFNQDLVKLEEMSKQISDENIGVLSKYLRQLEQCLQHFEKLENYTYSPRKDLHKNFLNIHKFINYKITTIQQQEIEKEENRAAREDEKIRPVRKLPVAESINLQKTEMQLQKMKEIAKELAALVTITNFNERIMKEYDLLFRKANLCDGNDLDELIIIMNRINKLQIILRKLLISSAVKGDLISVRKLVQYVDFILPSTYFVCVKNGFTDVAIFLITHYKFNINTFNFIYVQEDAPVDLLGSTLLLVAVNNSRFAMVKWLLENGANPNLVNPNIGLTPLMIAVIKNLYQYAEVLFLYRTNPNAGCFTQSVALLTNSAHLAQAVVRQGEKNNTGDTALHYACKYNYAEFIELLFANNVDPVRLNLEKLPPYYYLLFREESPVNQKAMQFFINKGVDIDFKQPRGQITGLHFACQKGRFDDVKFLVKNGADPNMPTDLLTNFIVNGDEKGKDKFQTLFNEILRGDHKLRMTPLIRAVLKESDDIVEYLLDQAYTPVTIDTIYNALTLTKLVIPDNNCIKILTDKFLERQMINNKRLSMPR